MVSTLAWLLVSVNGVVELIVPTATEPKEALAGFIVVWTSPVPLSATVRGPLVALVAIVKLPF